LASSVAAAASEEAGAAGAAGAAADGSGAGAGAGAAGGATTAGASSFLPQAVSAAAAISDPSNRDFFITWLLWMKVSKILDLPLFRNMSQDVIRGIGLQAQRGRRKARFRMAKALVDALANCASSFRTATAHTSHVLDIDPMKKP
jgi:hypothetical protein